MIRPMTRPMTRSILFVLFTSLLSAATADTEVASFMETYRQAMLHKDAAALSNLLSDDLTYTHSSNQHQDKAAVLAAQKSKSVIEALDFKDMKIRVYGNSAVVTCDVDTRSNNAGAVSSLRLHVIHVLVKHPAGWQLVARQATRYPEAAAK
jgi:ketosteroid isomerase-like protein